MGVTAATLKRWRADFPKYAKEQLKIQTKEGTIEPFVLNRFQARLDAIVEEELKKPQGCRILLLKARQLGSSTYIAGRQYHKTTLWKNRTALTLAHDLDTAEALHRKPLLFWNMSAPDVRPERKLSNRRELQFSRDDVDGTGDVGLQSRIAIATAKDSHAGIGLTIHALHLSEAARYESVTRDAQDLFIGMMQAVPKQPGTMVVLETTAYGLGWFSEFWETAIGWRRVFVSWLCSDEYTSDEPVAESDLSPAEDTRYGNEKEVLKDVERELVEWYPELFRADDRKDMLRHEALCRLAWRREQIDIAFAGDLQRFKQEYPSNPKEAFLTTGRSVFDTRKLADIRESCEGKPRSTERFDLQSGEFYPATYGPLRTYRAAESTGRYVIGADVAEGLAEGDYSVAQVLKVPELEQVAVFQGRVDPATFADVLFALGRRYNDAFIGVEVNGPGFATNLRLTTDLMYPLVYRRQSFDTGSRRYIKRYGWATNKGTKNVLLTDLRAALRDDLIIYNDIETLDEMGFYIQHDNGSMEASPGKHDDHVMSLGIALQMVVAGHFGDIKVKEKKQSPRGSWNWYSQLLSNEEKRKRLIGW